MKNKFLLLLACSVTFIPSAMAGQEIGSKLGEKSLRSIQEGAPEGIRCGTLYMEKSVDQPRSNSQGSEQGSSQRAS